MGLCLFLPRCAKGAYPHPRSNAPGSSAGESILHRENHHALALARSRMRRNSGPYIPPVYKVQRRQRRSNKFRRSTRNLALLYNLCRNSNGNLAYRCPSLAICLPGLGSSLGRLPNHANLSNNTGGTMAFRSPMAPARNSRRNPTDGNNPPPPKHYAHPRRDREQNPTRQKQQRLKLGLLLFQHLIGKHANLVVFDKFAGFLIPPPRSMLHYVLTVALDAVLLASAEFAVGMATFA